jgi:hypothetical protein
VKRCRLDVATAGIIYRRHNIFRTLTFSQWSLLQVSVGFLTTILMIPFKVHDFSKLLRMLLL